MLIVTRRKELNLSMNKLVQLSGVPRYRLTRLETGAESLRLTPFFQAGAIARALDLPIDVMYNAVMDPQYKEWIIRRSILNARSIE